jgi:hypothetical protein
LVKDTEGKAVGFKGKLGTAIVSFLLWASIAGAQSDEAGRLKVMVLDSAGLSPAVLRRAENESARIFRDAGIDILWINCLKRGEAETCHHVLEANEFMLHIVPRGNTRTDLVFGEAFLGEDGSGKYADVFFDRIKAGSGPPELDTAQLLGAVAAHELGHLLLGSRAHSHAGIMQPVWERECLRRIWMGSLLFTQEQARSIQLRIGVRTRTLMAVRGPYRKGFDPGY